MLELAPALALFEGFWGRVFEYWPFFFTVGVTIVFGVIALSADLVWRRKIPPPEGAMPRIDIPVDPRVAPRQWVNRGRTMVRFGCGMGIFLGFIYAAFALNPQGLNDQFGLPQDQDPRFAAGALLSLAALIVAYASTVALRRQLWLQSGVLLVAAFVAMTAPWLFTGDPGKLAVSGGVLGLSTAFMLLGVGYTVHGVRGLSEADRADSATGGG